MASPLKKYLDYYKTCAAPGYAVLVTGDWGTGKTFQVTNALAADEQYYVSLFGLQTADEVHSAVLAVTSPKLFKTRKFFDSFGATAEKIGGLYSLGRLLPGAMNILVRQVAKPDRTLIFDDLERCGPELRDIIVGIINSYVEHLEFRVVVIAHDTKLVSEITDAKEKLFGQAIRVEPDIAGAFDAFSTQLLKDKKLEFLMSHRTEITSIFNASKVKSLRILRHIIEDLGRLYETLSSRHLDDVEAMSELVCLFSALNMEVRSSNPLLEWDLKNRQNISGIYSRQYSSEKGEKPDMPKIVVADKKYDTVDLTNNLLQDNLVAQMLIEGHYDQVLVRASLDNSHYFLTPEDTPPWKKVINFDDLEDDVVEDALKQMQKQFDDRQVTDSGEMLHIFALRMMMADKGAIDDDIPTIIKGCKAYIDDLLATNRLPPSEINSEFMDGIDRGGYGFWLADDNVESFNEIKGHLTNAREKAFEKTFPQITGQMIELIKTDGQAFFEQVCHTNNGDNPYALIPILHHIPAEEFVSAWMLAPKENWRKISYALQGRYEHNRLNNEMAAEKEWAQQIVSLLKSEAKKAEGLQALRIERAIPNISLPLDDAQS